MSKVIRFFKYVIMVICDIRALSDAMNEAASTEELDAFVESAI